jgi:hypothetical protein
MFELRFINILWNLSCKCAKPHFNHYKTKSDTETCIGLIAKLRAQLLILSITTVYNAFSTFALMVYR